MGAVSRRLSFLRQGRPPLAVHKQVFRFQSPDNIVSYVLRKGKQNRGIDDFPLCGNNSLVGQYKGLFYMVILIADKGVQGAMNRIILAGFHHG